MIALYRQRLLDGVAGDREAGQLRKADSAERLPRLAGLEAERKAIFRLARHSHLSDELSRKLVREIDLLESRYN